VIFERDFKLGALNLESATSRASWTQWSPDPAPLFDRDSSGPFGIYRDWTPAGTISKIRNRSVLLALGRLWDDFKIKILRKNGPWDDLWDDFTPLGRFHFPDSPVNQALGRFDPKSFPGTDVTTNQDRSRPLSRLWNRMNPRLNALCHDVTANSTPQVPPHLRRFALNLESATSRAFWTQWSPDSVYRDYRDWTQREPNGFL